MKFHLGSQDLIADELPELKNKYPNLNVYQLTDTSPNGDASSVFVEQNLDPQQVVAAAHKRNLRHVVQKNEGYFGKSLESAGRLVLAAAEYFQNDYQFAEEPIVRNVTLSFKGREDKDNLKSQSQEFIESIKSTSVATAADAIIEELYMNAVIDAPREAANMGIKVANPVNEMFLCQTENWLQISCTDPYGSLIVRKLIGRMDEVYEKGAGQAINLDGAEGAGLGCVILFEQSTCFIVGVQAGQKTKVTCLIPLGVSNRQRAEMRKSLHWFEI